MLDIAIIILILVLHLTAVFGAGRSYAGPVAMISTFMVVQTVVRPLTIALELDAPYLVTGGDHRKLLTDTLRLSLLWTATYVLVLLFGATRNGLSRSSVAPKKRRPPLITDQVCWYAAPALLALALAGTIPLLQQHGGIWGLAEAVKSDKAPVFFFWRACALWAAVLAGPLAMIYFQKRSFLRASTAGIVSIIAGTISFSWGARDALVFPLLAMVALAASRRSRRPTVTQILKVTLAVTLIVSVAYQLRLTRDEGIGAVSGVSEDAATVRRVSVSINATMFDALMTAKKDWPEEEQYVGFTYFKQGFPFVATSPDRPLNLYVMVAQRSVATRVNGTPTTAIGDWYVSFGYMGAVVGAALSAVLVTMLERRHMHSLPRSQVFGIAFSIIVSFGILQGGIASASLLRARSLLLPVVVILLIAVLERRTTVGQLREARQSEAGVTIRSVQRMAK